MTATVSRRLVLLFPGFEPMSPADHVGRLAHGAAKTGRTWNVSIALEGERPDARPFLADTRWCATAGDWRTLTNLVVCGWGDLVLAYAARPGARRLLCGLLALADFIVTGTVFRYCRTSWRYALFFAFPLVVMAAIIAGGLAIATVPAWAGWPAWHAAWSLPLGLGLAGLLLFFAVDRRSHLMTAMDDWAMAADLCRGRNPDLTQRTAAFRDEIAARIAAGEADEVVVAAHSLGASFAVVALAEALTKTGPVANLHVLTVGSSLMKTALHPAAAFQRDAVRALVSTHRLPWVDVQAITDPINFYRSHPARSLGIADGLMPSVMRISLSRLLLPETFKRIRLNFFRLHRQFVLGVERRRAYAFHLILFGPVPFARFAQAGTIDLEPLAPAAGLAGAKPAKADAA